MTHIERLVRHGSWANQRWIDQLESLADGDEYLVRLVSHLLLAERVWFQRIRGEAPDGNIWNLLPITDIQTLQARHTNDYAEILLGDIERVVAYRRFSGEQHQSPVSDIVLHLCTHGAHHRGQMATYASGRGLEFPKTDFINFCVASQR